MFNLKERYKKLEADQIVALWLIVWWIVNMVTAAASELANDEAYYHLFARNLEWGYFDHPPVTALLVWCGERFFGGEFAVRFFFTLLQPAYLLLFWRMIRPSEASRRDAGLYVMICASMLILQLYGFIAVPDGPLLFSSALFLLAFKRFTEDKKHAWLWLGLSIGFMAYCKYQGALVLIFALLANVKWFLQRPKKIALLCASGVVALVTILPHLVWQYNHDWVSFAYHLSGRNGVFRLSNVTEFLLNMAVVFSPFFLPLWVQSFRKVKPATPFERTLWLFPPAFILFFTASAVRGYVQPQWAIAAVFGLIWILFEYARRHKRTRRYVMCAGWVTIALIVLVRAELIWNPAGVKFEVFDNRSSYNRIAEIADGRPVIFDSSYAVAAKYAFYNDTDEVFSQPNVNHRTSQWQFTDNDTKFAGREVLVQVDPLQYITPSRSRTGELHGEKLANGKDFWYVVVKDFRPTRKVSIEVGDFELPERVHAGDRFDFTLGISNPYPYDIEIDGEEVLLEMLWGWRKQEYRFYPLAKDIVLPAGGTVEVGCTFEVPDELPQQNYNTGFALRNRYMYTWFCGKPMKTCLEK